MRQRPSSSSRAHNNTVSCLIPMESEPVTSINTTPTLDHIKKQLCDDIEAAGEEYKVWNIFATLTQVCTERVLAIKEIVHAYNWPSITLWKKMNKNCFI